MKRWLPGIAVLVAVAVIVFATLAWQLQRFLHTPVEVDGASIAFEIAPGSSLTAITRQLADKGIISKPDLFRFYARLTGEAGKVQAGEYQIDSGTTPAVLLDKFTSGDVRLYSFTIVEGWTQWDLLRALHENPHVEASLARDDWDGFLSELGAGTAHPEGLFLPETYHFPRRTTDRDVLRQAYTLMQKTLAEEWERRDEGLPLESPYDALILASIVEKETARADERARIAGVFTRRLQKRMRLQTDPTVIYGIGPDFDGNLTRRDLQTDTPYNTYTRGGLPPTPIAMPGRDAIRAALQPAGGDELYFVATGLGDGSHRFSETKEQHDDAVAEYLRQLRRNRRQDM